MAGAVAEFTDENFETEVRSSKQPVLVDFWAPWCGPCRQIAPMIDELARDNPGVKVGKVNIDEHPMIAQQLGITSIPTLMFFKDGQVSESVIGVRPKASLQQIIDTVKS
jgi:thioredoxin 1